MNEFLSVTVPTCDNFLILGDFNIHVCCPSKPLASEFLQLIDSFNFTQFVSGSTHRAGCCVLTNVLFDNALC